MIILMCACAVVILSAGYFIGANVKRAFYESLIEELEAQRDAARTMLDHAKFELAELKSDLDELMPLDAPPVPVSFCDPESATAEGTWATGMLGRPEFIEANQRATAQMLRLVRGVTGGDPPEEVGRQA